MVFSQGRLSAFVAIGQIFIAFLGLKCHRRPFGMRTLTPANPIRQHQPDQSKLVAVVVRQEANHHFAITAATSSSSNLQESFYCFNSQTGAFLRNRSRSDCRIKILLAG